MKEAMWGVGLITVSLFGIFLVNIFGNLTVTNQQDYTAMTNTVEAAMNDARDVAHYRTGFCVCTSKAKVNGKWIFNSSSDYEIVDPANNKCPTVSYKTCELIEGEYKIDKKIFAESLTRRFAQSVKANNDYQIIVQDVIEYPPKVSVLVKAKSEENYAAVGGEFIITNQIDSILESVENINSSRYTVTVKHLIENTNVKVHDDDVITVESGQNYVTSSHFSNELYNEYANKYAWNEKTPNNATGVSNSDKNIVVTYYYKENNMNEITVTVKHFIDNTSIKVHDDDVYVLKNEGDLVSCYGSAHLSSELYPQYANTYGWIWESTCAGMDSAKTNRNVYYSRYGTTKNVVIKNYYSRFWEFNVPVTCNNRPDAYIIAWQRGISANDYDEAKKKMLEFIGRLCSTKGGVKEVDLEAKRKIGLIDTYPLRSYSPTVYENNIRESRSRYGS